MPPKKRRPLVWCPLVYKPLVTSDGEVREYYLPLSKEEIEEDLQHLGSLLQAHAAGKGVRRAAGRSAALMMQHAAAGQGAESSEDGYSPSSQQGEDENESGNPSEQQWGGKASALVRQAQQQSAQTYLPTAQQQQVAMA